MNASALNEKRLSTLEQEFKESQITTGQAIAKISAAIETISETNKEIARSVSEMRADAAAAEQHRLNEKDHRDRIDRRVDDIAKDFIDLQKAIDKNTDKIYNRVREVEEKVNALDTKQAVAESRDTTADRSIQSIQAKAWQAVFWIITLVGGLIAANYFKNQ
jgi:hypothetical protein